MRLSNWLTYLTLAVPFGIPIAANAAGDPICNFKRDGFGCIPCEGFSQAVYRDFPRANCISCSAVCFGYGKVSASDTPLDAKSFVQSESVGVAVETVKDPFAFAGLNDSARLDTAALFDKKALSAMAQVNPSAAGLLYTVESNRRAPIDLASGVAFSQMVDTNQTFTLPLNGAPADDVLKSMVPTPEGLGLRVEWRIVESVDGRASGTISSQIVDKENRVVRAAYPAIKLEFLTRPTVRLVSWATE